MDNQDPNNDIVESLKELDDTLEEMKKEKENEASKGKATFTFEFPKEIPDVNVKNLKDIEFPKIPEFPQMPEFPSEVRVSNLDEIPIPQPQKLPDSFNIKKPAWLPLAFAPLKPIKNVLDEISSKLDNDKELVFPTKANQPISVRLSDGENWINQLTQVIQQTSGGSSIPSVRLADGSVALPVVNPDGTEISGGTGGGDGAIVDGVSSTIKATVFDLSNSNPLATQIVDANGDAITSFGGGTQYTEGDTDSSITGTALMWEDTSDTLRAVSAAKPLPINIISGNISGFATSAKQDTIIGHVDGIETLLTAIDGHVDGLESVDFATQTTLAAIKTKTDNIPALGQALAAGSVPVVLTAAQLSTLTPLSTVAVTQSGAWDEVGINDSGNSITVDAPVGTPVFVRLSDGSSAISTLPVSLASVPSHAVTNAGTFAVQVDGNALTSLQLIDDIVYTDDTSTHSTGSSKGALLMAAAAPTDTAVNANDIGAVGMTVKRELYVSLTTALPAGTNAIGKLAANSGVDIGDVDVTSIAAGTNLIGDVGIQPRTTNGLDTFMASGSDGSSILVATAQAVKASAGKVYGYYLYNPEAAVTFVHFYNTASGSVTVGTTNPLFTLQIPPASAANLMSEIGITFGTAITIAATTTAGGNTAPATGVSATIWFK